MKYIPELHPHIIPSFVQFDGIMLRLCGSLLMILIREGNHHCKLPSNVPITL